MIEILQNYKNENLDLIYNKFSDEFYKDDLLVKHRYYIEEKQLGFGDRPFHVLWREIVKLQPSNFKFIEIGVYKGQVLSLVKLLSDSQNKFVEFYGVTPLDNSSDKFSHYEQTNYGNIIESIFKNFNLKFNVSENIIKGSSIEEDIKNKVRELGFFDLVYIDGCHDYDCVVSDIYLMKEITKKGSYIVFDDASCYKRFQQGIFKGHVDVCEAIKVHIEKDDSFSEIICVGHNRVFLKIK